MLGASPFSKLAHRETRNPRQRVLRRWRGGVRCGEGRGGRLEQESGCGPPRVGLEPGRVGGAVLCGPARPVSKGRRARGWGLGLPRRDGAVYEAPERGPAPPLTSWLVLGVDCLCRWEMTGPHVATGVSAASWTTGE